MSELRRFPRRPRMRPSPRLLRLFPALSLVLLFLLAALLTFFRARSAAPCRTLPSPHASSPDLMLVSLVDAHTCTRAVAAHSALRLHRRSCILRLYVATERALRHCAASVHAACTGGCHVEVRLHRGARMWGDVALEDVGMHTTVLFVRGGVRLTRRAVEWVELAHRATREFYGKGGRREVVGVVVGCGGERALGAWWAHPAGVLNGTCVFSPTRGRGEDLWAFFVRWFQGRRREWVAWPHVWNEEVAVPTFWKGKTRTRRDRKLMRFGEATGLDYGYVGDAALMWERWYPRWAVNYTMRVLPAEGSLGLREDGARGEGDEVGNRGKVVVEGGEGKGVYETRFGDVVRVGDVWYEPVDAEFGAGYFRALQRIVGRKPEMISLTIVNSKFIELTKSWLCNVKVGGFEPPNIVWIALDKHSKTFLDESGVGETVDVTDALMADNMDAVDIIYGHPAYWKLMLMRTRLIRDLLDRGIDVFLFETDQVWLQDPFLFIQRELEGGADMVGTLDTQHNVAGNTILLRSVLSTRRMWTEVYHRFKMSYDDKEIESREKHSSTFVQHDQYQLSALLLFDTKFTQDFPVALGLLNSQLFVGGSWYSGMYSTAISMRPVIINNNFISGTEKKKARAKIFGHWFVTDDGKTCDRNAARNALRYEFSKLPGKWWAQEQRRLVASMIN